MKKKCFIIAIAAVALCALAWSGFQQMHSCTLSGGTLKSEQIQPILGTVTVSGNTDTDVIFTDVDSGETYVIGYITQGMREEIRLETGHWYSVQGDGELTLRPVRLRVS